MRPSTARPKRMARSTAPLLSTGSVPGSARSTAAACVLGGAPKAVEAPEKIFDAVVSCAWVSSPMTISQVIGKLLHPQINADKRRWLSRNPDKHESIRANFDELETWHVT